MPTGASAALPGPSQQPPSILPKNAPHPHSDASSSLCSTGGSFYAYLGFSCGPGDWEKSTFACSDPEAILQTTPQAPLQEVSTEHSVELDVSRTP